jgi:hypothetical protein
MPREITVPVTFKVGSVRALGLVGGPPQPWTRDDPAPDRHYELSIGEQGNLTMTAKALHGDRRLNAHADLTGLREALFGELGRLLEVPVFACCDQPQPASGGVCENCQTRLSDDQVMALTGCPHPTLTGVPPGEREPCPDCGLAWCQALGSMRWQPTDVDDFHVLTPVDQDPCPRVATGRGSDGSTLCGHHQDPGLLIIQSAEQWARHYPGRGT